MVLINLSIKFVFVFFVYLNLVLTTLLIKRNIVSTVNLDCPLVLKDIALQARNAEYNPRRFAAVVMRLRKPKTTALVFASGKMVCTGAKTENESRIAARKYARIIQVSFVFNLLYFQSNNKKEIGLPCQVPKF